MKSPRKVPCDKKINITKTDMLSRAMYRKKNVKFS